MKENNLTGCTYIEPFAGGAGLAMELLFRNEVSKVILNDIDKSIYSVWYSILNNTEEMINLISEIDLTLDNWYNQKKIQENKENATLLDLGFSTLFLNRTNRSGIIGAGPIGGKSQNGNYKLDCRFNKEDIISRILLIASRKSDIKFYNYDAIHFTNRIVSRQQKKTFVFFDPPYHEKGPGLYLNSFNDSDHRNLASKIKDIKQHWIVTYDNTDFIKSLYDEFNSTIYELNYSLQEKKTANEIMIYGPTVTPSSFK